MSFRALLGAEFRRIRHAQNRHLTDVAATAHVSHGYLSEVERGKREPSSEVIAAICRALDVPLGAVLRQVSDLVGDQIGRAA
jgi:transcriptional regulator with XRE-family HTH domain